MNDFDRYIRTIAYVVSCEATIAVDAETVVDLKESRMTEGSLTGDTFDLIMASYTTMTPARDAARLVTERLLSRGAIHVQPSYERDPWMRRAGELVEALDSEVALAQVKKDLELYRTAGISPDHAVQAIMSSDRGPAFDPPFRPAPVIPIRELERDRNTDNTPDLERGRARDDDAGREL